MSDIPGSLSPFFQMRPLFRLNSPGLTVTDADKNQNSTFNTNLSAIESNFAMVIHSIDLQLNISGALATDMYALITFALSENQGATSALVEADNSTSLWLGQKGWYQEIQTSGMGIVFSEDIKRHLFDPWPLITVAQTLNILAEMTEVVAASTPDFIVRMFINYTLEPIDATLRQRLLERITLSTT